MDVVKHLLARAREGGVADADCCGPVRLSIPATHSAVSGDGSGAKESETPSAASPPSEGAYETTIYIPSSVALSQPMLQRLRRKYTQIQRGGIAHGQGYVKGRKGVVKGFVEFLEHEWNDDDDDE